MRLRLAALALLFDASLLAGAEVRFLAPPPGHALFGDVEVVLVLSPEDTACDRLELYFDGRRVGVFDRPPYRIVVNAGQENLPHRLEAVAYRGGAVVASGSLQSPKIYTDEEITVDLHHVYASVTRQGEPVVGLKQEDFTLFFGGSLQTLSTFETVEVPFTAVLLLDTSLSMEGDRLEVARRGAEAFLLAMGQLDLVVEAGLQTYDILPLIPIIERAGGIVTTWDGADAKDGGNILAAGDARMHEAAMQVLAA